MTKPVNRARMTTATTGTGTITLGSAVTKFQTFAAAGVVDADVIRYVIEDGNAWEIGVGTYIATGTTMSRTLLSSSTGSLLALSGAAQVYITATAEDLVTLTAGDGTAAAPSHSFDSDPNTGMYRIGADTLGLATGGSERLRIDSTGQVGIGVTPTVALDVNGSAKYKFLDSGAGSLGEQGIVLTSIDSAASQFYPQVLLHNKSNGLNGGPYWNTRKTNGDTGAATAGHALGTFNFQSTDTGGTVRNAASLAIVSSGAGATNHTASFIFRTTSSTDSTPVERFRIGSLGQFGIGTGPSYGIEGEAITSSGSAAQPAWRNAEYWIMNAATYTLASGTGLQKIFNDPTNGAVTLPVGTYEYETFVRINGLSATSGNVRFDVLGAGTATLSNLLSLAAGQDNNASTTANITGSWWTGTGNGAAGVNLLSPSVDTVVTFWVRGYFRCTVGGTLIPSIGKTTSETTSQVQPPSFFKVKRLDASATAVKYGPWT